MALSARALNGCRAHRRMSFVARCMFSVVCCVLHVVCCVLHVAVAARSEESLLVCADVDVHTSRVRESQHIALRCATHAALHAASWALRAVCLSPTDCGMLHVVSTLQTVECCMLFPH